MKTATSTLVGGEAAMLSGTGSLRKPLGWWTLHAPRAMASVHVMPRSRPEG